MAYSQQKGYFLGSECIITLVSEEESEFKSNQKRLWNHITKFEKKFSRFQPDSELNKINLNAGKIVKVSAEMINILKLAIKYSNKTDRLFNPFILPALQKSGYKGSWPRPESFVSSLDFSDRKVVDISKLQIFHGSVKIPENTALDLGGIGKGYLLAKLANSLDDKLQGFYISLGGDLVVKGVDPSMQAWKVYISNANDPDHNACYVVSNKELLSVATSGVTKRNGVNWNHLISANTNKSIQNDILSASVVSSDPILADVLASCLVLADHKSRIELSRKFGFDGVIQLDSKTKHANEIVFLGNRNTFNP